MIASKYISWFRGVSRPVFRDLISALENRSSYLGKFTT
jgi:hypothetical protein